MTWKLPTASIWLLRLNLRLACMMHSRFNKKICRLTVSLSQIISMFEGIFSTNLYQNSKIKIFNRKCICRQYRSIEHMIRLKKLQKIFNLSKRVMQISDPIFLLIYFFATSVSDRRYLFSCRATRIQNWVFLLDIVVEK